jgi:hypothetical protein
MKRPENLPRNLICFVILALVAMAVIVFAKYRVPDPPYQGRDLSSILLTLSPNGFSWSWRSTDRTIYTDTQGVSLFGKKALNDLGPKAVPLVRHWLRSERPKWMLRLVAKYPKSRWIPPTWRADLKQKALVAAFISPEVGRATFEDVFLCLTNSQWSFLAAAAVTETMASHPELDHEMIVRRILVMQTEALQPKGYYAPDAAGNWNSLQRVLDFADPQYWIRSLIILERGEEPAKVGAAKKVIEDPAIAQRALSLLITNLQSPNRGVIEACANSLASYGPAASNALPFLSNYLSHPKAYVSSAASNAIARITARVSSTAGRTNSIANLPP